MVTGALQQVADQEVLFNCIEYHTTSCTYDITNNNLNMYENSQGQHSWVDGEDSGSGAGTYAWAMREFARCASVSPEPAGFCRGSISSADKLANHDVCTAGATTNIGFHIRVPFKVNVPGDFNFRLHADYVTSQLMLHIPGA